MPTTQDTRLIPLTQGKVAIVDAADYEWLSQWKWCAWKPGKADSVYAARKEYLPGGKQRTIYMHRLIMGEPVGLEVDHRNWRNKLDNRRGNLRCATHAQNVCNKGLRADNTSGFVGVSFDKQSKRWLAKANINRKQTFLGYFDSPEFAARARDAAVIESHGEFAFVNLPKE